MKRNLSLFLLALLPMLALTTFTSCGDDDDDVVVSPNGGIDKTNHKYVDLGLPSGTLWATCNVGANKPEDYGDYFAWGETEPKTTYNWISYKLMNGGQSSWLEINKYTFADGQTYVCWYDYLGNFIGDGKPELEPADDAATVNWGSNWRMPTIEQLKELFNRDYTTTKWTTLSGVYGRKITSRSNGKSVFLPAAGCRYGTILDRAGSYGDYWSRSLYTSNSGYAYSLGFNSDDIYASDYGSRSFGQSVRPVRVKN